MKITSRTKHRGLKIQRTVCGKLVAFVPQMGDTSRTAKSKRHGGHMRFKLGTILAALLLGATSFVLSQDVATDADKTAKDAGHDTKVAAKKTGHATQDTADKTGHATKNAATKTGHAAKTGAA